MGSERRSRQIASNTITTIAILKIPVHTSELINPSKSHQRHGRSPHHNRRRIVITLRYVQVPQFALTVVRYRYHDITNLPASRSRYTLPEATNMPFAGE